ncbi:MAG: Bro-N domain-containing protein [Butyricicoccus sp.]
MNDGMLTVSNSEFGKLNILVENGKELFPANDAAKLLGYTNPYGAVQKHCRSLLKREVPHPQSPDKKITVNFISEGDLYRLIIRSRLPAAQKFEKWLFDEVLPELRRTGGYRAKPAADLPHQWMGRGCIRIDDAAKVLGVKKDKIRELLNKRKTVYRNGVDWETLHGYEVDEYKFYNRVPTAAKGICIVYDSGMAKLRWKLLGEGSPDMALPAAAEVPLLPAAVQEENEQLRFALEEIGKIAGKLGK